MTEAEWLACTDARKMLDFVQLRSGKRKLMLFASACCHRIGDLLPRKECRDVIEMLDLYADGLADCDDLLRTARAAGQVSRRIKHPAKSAAAHAIDHVQSVVTMESPWWAAGVIAALARDAREPAIVAEAGAQGALIRCIFGNPFLSSRIVPIWQTMTVASLAESIYADRAFDRLPFLADALEDAGCTDAAILDHCRQPGVHARGCWVLDLVLGKS